MMKGIGNMIARTCVIEIPSGLAQGNDIPGCYMKRENGQYTYCIIQYVYDVYKKNGKNMITADVHIYDDKLYYERLSNKKLEKVAIIKTVIGKD